MLDARIRKSCGSDLLVSLKSRAAVLGLLTCLLREGGREEGKGREGTEGSQRQREFILK